MTSNLANNLHLGTNDHLSFPSIGVTGVRCIQQCDRQDNCSSRIPYQMAMNKITQKVTKYNFEFPVWELSYLGYLCGCFLLGCQFFGIIYVRTYANEFPW